jgi:N-glycosidase YbiA
MNELQVINAFKGPHRFLSNFAPCETRYNGILYKTSEHAYQASKAKTEADHDAIANAPTPGAAKRMGHTILTSQIRNDWDMVKFAVMEEILIRKFSNPAYHKLLLETGDAILIEGNDWGDRYWGMEFENGHWVGLNCLGILLMYVRARIRAGIAWQP